MKKILRMVVSLCLCCTLIPQIVFAKSESLDIPEEAIVIYAENEEDAQRQMQEYTTWTVVEPEVHEERVQARVNLKGIHFYRRVVNGLNFEIFLDYYYDTVNDRPTSVYKEAVAFNEPTGTNLSVNNLYTRIENGRYIVTDMNIHFEFYIILDGIGKVRTENHRYAVKHDVVTGSVNVSEYK